ncbi:MAG: rhodanese-like domain-containing protein [Anaerococcus hydrogenalis]|nr:rhodanese-like domain-containing protein [Anaerococcus hydrogenalis]
MTFIQYHRLGLTIFYKFVITLVVFFFVAKNVTNKTTINIPANKINPDNFKNKNKYLIYCQSGIMAKSVVKTLQKQGLDNIYYLEGSMNYIEKYQKTMGVHILE